MAWGEISGKVPQKPDKLKVPIIKSREGGMSGKGRAQREMGGSRDN